MKNIALATIKERYRISGADSSKETHHVVLDVSGTELRYTVGDCIGIYPTNSPDLVERTICAMNASGEEMIVDKRSQKQHSLREFFTKKANIRSVNKILQKMISGPNDGREVWDFLQENKNDHLSPQEVCDSLQPLLPSLYSIASSQQVVGDEVHLTVNLQKYISNGHPRVGVASSYLCSHAPIGEASIPAYIQPHRGFTLPTDPSTSMIMIGPGTGIAPFRGFLQERTASQAPGKNWLFFGEWTQKNEFFYEKEWLQWQEEGKLRLNTAFSRDQEHKIYVQHRLLEQATETWQWIQNGAYLYVCGDIQMGKEIDAVLQKILQKEGNLDENSARQYLKQLRKDKRYLKDVY